VSLLQGGFLVILFLCNVLLASRSALAGIWEGSERRRADFYRTMALKTAAVLRVAWLPQ
jgi:hypothetical protein